MARTWLSIRVELLGGHGDDLWPYPGRVLLVGPIQTFADLAQEIDDAFARWDRAQQCRFTLADGTVVTDEGRTKVIDRVNPGDEFMYLFDFGDRWTHACTVDDAKVDPIEVLGATPEMPTASRGWGSIPDQYGRRWDGDTPGEPMPRRPALPHPMRSGRWPEEATAQPVDLPELLGATYRRDVPAILAAIEGRDIEELLQHVGTGVQVVLSVAKERGEALAVSVVNRLEERGLTGDDVLAEDLLAQLHGTPVVARRLSVDLSELASELSGDPNQEAGFLDLQTGEVIPWTLTDPMYVGEDSYIDIDADFDRYLRLDRPDSRAQWQDMAEFAERQPNADLRRRLERSIEGRGAFRRFRNAIYEEDLVEQWRRFSEDREIGRARAYLAEEGIRVLPA